MNTHKITLTAITARKYYANQPPKKLLDSNQVEISILYALGIFISQKYICNCSSKHYTVFENYWKCLIWIFGSLVFFVNFCAIKSDLTGNYVCIVNVARFARNVECDFFCDFQTLCIIIPRNFETALKLSLAWLHGGKKVEKILMLLSGKFVHSANYFDRPSSEKWNFFWTAALLARSVKSHSEIQIGGNENIMLPFTDH